MALNEQHLAWMEGGQRWPFNACWDYVEKLDKIKNRVKSKVPKKKKKAKKK